MKKSYKIYILVLLLSSSIIYTLANEPQKALSLSEIQTQKIQQIKDIEKSFDATQDYNTLMKLKMLFFELPVDLQKKIFSEYNQKIVNSVSSSTPQTELNGLCKYFIVYQEGDFTIPNDSTIDVSKKKDVSRFLETLNGLKGMLKGDSFLTVDNYLTDNDLLDRIMGVVNSQSAMINDENFTQALKKLTPNDNSLLEDNINTISSSIQEITKQGGYKYVQGKLKNYMEYNTLTPEKQAEWKNKRDDPIERIFNELKGFDEDVQSKNRIFPEQSYNNFMVDMQNGVFDKKYSSNDEEGQKVAFILQEIYEKVYKPKLLRIILRNNFLTSSDRQSECLEVMQEMFTLYDKHSLLFTDRDPNALLYRSGSEVLKQAFLIDGMENKLKALAALGIWNELGEKVPNEVLKGQHEHTVYTNKILLFMNYFKEKIDLHSTESSADEDEIRKKLVIDLRQTANSLFPSGAKASTDQERKEFSHLDASIRGITRKTIPRFAAIRNIWRRLTKQISVEEEIQKHNNAADVTLKKLKNPLTPFQSFLKGIEYHNTTYTSPEDLAAAAKLLPSSDPVVLRGTDEKPSTQENNGDPVRVNSSLSDQQQKEREERELEEQRLQKEQAAKDAAAKAEKEKLKEKEQRNGKL